MEMRRRARLESGQAVVEFGLTLMIFLGLTCAILDFGRAIWSYNTLSNATREGARYASTVRLQPNGTIAVASCDLIRARVRSFAFGMDLPDASIGAGYGNYVHNGTLRTATLGAPCTSFSVRPLGKNPQDQSCFGSATCSYYVTVSAVVEFRPITPLIGGIVGNGGVIPLRSDAMMVTSF